MPTLLTPKDYRSAYQLRPSYALLVATVGAALATYSNVSANSCSSPTYSVVGEGGCVYASTDACRILWRHCRARVLGCCSYCRPALNICRSMGGLTSDPAVKPATTGRPFSRFAGRRYAVHDLLACFSFSMVYPTPPQHSCHVQATGASMGEGQCA